MAISQLEDSGETIEEALARANAEAQAKRKAAQAGTFPCASCGYAGPVTIDLEDNTAVRRMCKEELAIAIRQNSGRALVGSLIKELMDRIDGKAPQAINLHADINSTSVHFDIKGGAELITQGIKEKLERRRKQLAITHDKPLDVVKEQ